MYLWMQQDQVMGSHSNLPKVMDLIRNFLCEYSQVCGKATCQNPHQTIENFGT